MSPAHEPMPSDVALVTGATGGGIGTGIARLLLAEGYSVYGIERTPKSEEELARLGLLGKVELIVGDAGTSEPYAEFDRLLACRPPARLVGVHNAARGSPWKSLQETSEEDFTQDVSDILIGGFLLTRTVARYASSLPDCRVVYISSSAAVRGARRRGLPYAAAKAGLHGLMVQSALELADCQATVNCVVPFQTLTPRVLSGGRRSEAEIRETARLRVPLGRPALPDDVASLVVFLASRDSAYITAQAIHVDGGQQLAPRQSA